MSGEESSAFSEDIRFLAHEEARPGQLEMIHDCLNALHSRGHHLAAAPTGIGKTAAALAAAIDSAKLIEFTISTISFLKVLELSQSICFE